MMPKARRSEKHRQFGAWLEQTLGPRTEEFSELVAHHWTEAGDDRRALDYLERSGDRAMDSFAVAEALSYYGDAIELAERLGDVGRRAVNRLRGVVTHEGEPAEPPGIPAARRPPTHGPRRRMDRRRATGSGRGTCSTCGCGGTTT